MNRRSFLGGILATAALPFFGWRGGADLSPPPVTRVLCRAEPPPLFFTAVDVPLEITRAHNGSEWSTIGEGGDFETIAEWLEARGVVSRVQPNQPDA